MILALCAGVVIGLVLGALGGGGAILAVPALVYLLQQPPQAAMAGALVIVAVSAVTAVLTHARAGRVQWRQGILFGLIGGVGAFVGGRLSGLVDGGLLLFWFGVLLLVVAGLMIRRTMRAGATPETGVAAADRAGAPEPASGASAGSTPSPMSTPNAVSGANAASGPSPAWGRLIMTASGVGLLTGFFGVGGGFAVVPALVLALDLPMTTAVGTSLVVITLNSLTALASRLSAGVTPDWRVVLPFAATAAIASVVGARLARRVPAAVLSRAFAGLLVAVGVWMGSQGLAAYV